VNLDEIAFEVGFSLKRTTATVPADLRSKGVTYLREPATSMEAQGTLTGTRATMERNAKAICRELQLDYRHMRVKRMKVSHNGTQVVFTSMLKNMEDEENGTKRRRVLGMVLPDTGEEGVLALIRALSAQRVYCRYSITPVQTVICQERDN
jgi:hypothetical protein